MVQYAPMWGAQIYGPPPKGYKDPESPQILFIHMNLEKLRGVSDSPNTHILMHYDPPVLPNAKNTLIGGRIGPCTWLQSCDVDESKCKVNLDQFDDFMPEFKQDYEKIIKALA